MVIVLSNQDVLSPSILLHCGLVSHLKALSLLPLLLMHIFLSCHDFLQVVLSLLIKSPFVRDNVLHNIVFI